MIKVCIFLTVYIAVCSLVPVDARLGHDAVIASDWFAPVPATRRRLAEEEKQDAKPYADFLNAVTNTVNVVDGIANTAKNVINLFASSSTETLTKEFTDRGYDNLNANTVVVIKKNIKIEAFYAVMSRSLKGMNIPKQYQEGINSLIETALYIEQDSWHENDVTFSTGKGGEAKNFQVFTYRSMGSDGCEAMQFILIGSKVGFDLAPDVFLISHSTSKMGGAFTKQKLEWKNKERPLSNDKDLKFVNTYFRTLSLSMVQELPALFNIQSNFVVRCLKDPPPQIDPFANGGGFGGAFDYQGSDDSYDMLGQEQLGLQLGRPHWGRHGVWETDEESRL